MISPSHFCPQVTKYCDSSQIYERRKLPNLHFFTLCNRKCPNTAFWVEKHLTKIPTQTIDCWSKSLQQNTPLRYLGDKKNPATKNNGKRVLNVLEHWSITRFVTVYKNTVDLVYNRALNKRRHCRGIRYPIFPIVARQYYCRSQVEQNWNGAYLGGTC